MSRLHPEGLSVWFWNWKMVLDVFWMLVVDNLLHIIRFRTIISPISISSWLNYWNCWPSQWPHSRQRLRQLIWFHTMTHQMDGSRSGARTQCFKGTGCTQIVPSVQFSHALFLERFRGIVKGFWGPSTVVRGK